MRISSKILKKDTERMLTESTIADVLSSHLGEKADQDIQELLTNDLKTGKTTDTYREEDWL